MTTLSACKIFLARSSLARRLDDGSSVSLKLPRANQSDLLRSPVRDVIEVG